MSKLMKNMNWKRKSKCPECKGKLNEFGVNVDEGTIECLSCHAKFSPIQVLQDSDIVFFSGSLPSDKQETFLTGLGFERKPVRRTPKSVLYGFLIFLIGSGVVFTLLFFLFGLGIKSIGPVIGSLLLSNTVYGYYKEEEKPQWQRKK